MIVELKMYSLTCDICGKDINEDSDYSCWNDAEPSLEKARDEGWHVGDDVYYCTDCHSFDDDDNMIVKVAESK